MLVKQELCVAHGLNTVWDHLNDDNTYIGATE